MEKHDAVLDSDGRCKITFTGAAGELQYCGAPATADWHFRYPAIGSAEFFGFEPDTTTEPQNMVEATPSDQTDEVAMFPNGAVVGDEDLPGLDRPLVTSWPTAHTEGPLGPGMAAAFGVDFEAITRGISGEAIRAAVVRVKSYMRGSFSEATIGGVVSAIENENIGPAHPLEPWSRRSDQPKEWCVVSGTAEVIGPMTEAAAHGLVVKLKKDEHGGTVQRMIHPSDL